MCRTVCPGGWREGASTWSEARAKHEQVIVSAAHLVGEQSDQLAWAVACESRSAPRELGPRDTGARVQQRHEGQLSEGARRRSRQAGVSVECPGAGHGCEGWTDRGGLVERVHASLADPGLSRADERYAADPVDLATAISRELSVGLCESRRTTWAWRLCPGAGWWERGVAGLNRARGQARTPASHSAGEG
jgi:hypothetical protein